jgi:hypothetical protein
MRFLKGVITLSSVSVGMAVFYVFGILVGLWKIPIEAREPVTPMEAALPDASAVFPWGVQIFESSSRDQVVNMFLALQQRLPGIIGISPPMVIASRNYSIGTALRQRVYLGVASRVEADNKCAALQQKGVACLVRRIDDKASPLAGMTRSLAR